MRTLLLIELWLSSLSWPSRLPSSAEWRSIQGALQPLWLSEAAPFYRVNKPGARSESSAFVWMQRAQKEKKKKKGEKFEVGAKFATKSLAKILINVTHSTSSVVTSATQVEMTWGKIFSLSQFPKLSKRILHIHKQKLVITCGTQPRISGISTPTFTCMKEGGCAGCMHSHTKQANQHRSVQSKVIIKKPMLLL